MKKNIFVCLSLLTMTTITHASAIMVTPSSPLTVFTNGSSENLDINNDGVNDFVFTSTYTSNPYGYTDDAGTADLTDDYHYQGTTELTQMSINSTSGFASLYTLPYNWLTSQAELGSSASQDLFSAELSSQEECNYDYSSCTYYDSEFTGGIMEYDLSGYIGFNFDISGNTHWGWLLADRSSGDLKINSWGWETAADTLIPIGVGASAVPVPAAVWLLGSGLLGLFGLARSKKREN